MPLAEVIIDPRTWAEADETRRREWRIAIEEVLDDPLAEFPPAARTLGVTTTEQGIALELRGADGAPIAPAALIPRDALGKHAQEYVDIIRRMEKADEGLGGPRIEALDMAKKLAHDDAGKTIARFAAPLGLDHPTCRRLFSLLFTLRVDTTRLSGHRGHRPVR